MDHIATIRDYTRLYKIRYGFDRHLLSELLNRRIDIATSILMDFDLKKHDKKLYKQLAEIEQQIINLIYLEHGNTNKIP